MALFEVIVCFIYVMMNGFERFEGFFFLQFALMYFYANVIVLSAVGSDKCVRKDSKYDLIFSGNYSKTKINYIFIKTRNVKLV